ncbi:MAG: ammonium transporter [Acidobacteriia bacterium]|nr:ammonium transporter [Terriglobia bacterium]MYG01983.1 ammonium transporter [Terriglobia bacterium]MYK08633.1 ammonium transporter [Terriglobia bacterium]
MRGHSDSRFNAPPVSRRTGILAAGLMFASMSVWAQQGANPSSGDLMAAVEQVQTHANILWTLVAACLVFWMQAGFAFVESGFTRAKNAAHIMMKNVLDMSMGALAFWLIGFGIMFGATNGLFGTDHFLLSPDNGGGDGQWEYTFWMFQVVFAATAATIVSGAMAERTQFAAYLIYSVAITAIIYPVFGHWAWGNLLLAQPSWLADMGFIDFAGSTVVHSVGGWAALAGAIVVGPRLGKYSFDGSPRAIPGHNLGMAALGVFILFLGWFGFNAGSTTTADGTVSRIVVNTFLAACSGSIFAMVVSWRRFGKPDVGITLNGVLAGLVGITAPCASVTPLGAIIIGAVSGVLVVFSIRFFDKVHVDDPVGAISVHGVCGVWGTLGAALLHENLFLGLEYDLLATLSVQLVGVVVAFVWTFGTAFVLFKLIKAAIGLRVTQEDEIEGLDLGEHNSRAYPDFQVSIN